MINMTSLTSLNYNSMEDRFDKNNRQAFKASINDPNLGYGDFTPSFWISRLIISILSLSGIFQTALIVGVLSEALVIPPDEKRILASMEK